MAACATKGEWQLCVLEIVSLLEFKIPAHPWISFVYLVGAGQLGGLCIFCALLVKGEGFVCLAWHCVCVALLLLLLLLCICLFGLGGGRKKYREREECRVLSCI
jgi:hypothetical protein